MELPSISMHICLLQLVKSVPKIFSGGVFCVLKFGVVVEPRPNADVIAVIRKRLVSHTSIADVLCDFQNSKANLPPSRVIIVPSS